MSDNNTSEGDATRWKSARLATDRDAARFLFASVRLGTWISTCYGITRSKKEETRYNRDRAK